MALALRHINVDTVVTGRPRFVLVGAPAGKLLGSRPDCQCDTMSVFDR